MCIIRVKVKAVFEVFPSIECDDVSQITVEYPEPGDELAVEVLDSWSDGVLVAFPDGRTTSMSFTSFDVVRNCGQCGLGPDDRDIGVGAWAGLGWMGFSGPGRPLPRA